MGDQPVSDLSYSHADISVRKRDRGSPPVEIQGYAFACSECAAVRIYNGHGYEPDRYAPKRCCNCEKEKYIWLTRKKLEEEITDRATGRMSLHLATLGTPQYTPWQDNLYAAEDSPLYWKLRDEMKAQFSRFIRSKWWRNRVDGCFYVIEVKTTVEEKLDGTDSSPRLRYRWKMHPHVHALVQHDEVHDFREKWKEQTGAEVYGARRVKGTGRSSLVRPIRYIFKYAMKDYGNPRLKGRYYERTGAFRASKGPKRS